MSPRVIELFKEASDMDERDRATLAGMLLESLDREADPDVEAAWNREIERRLDDLDAGRARLVPWEEVKKDLLKGSDAGPQD